MALYTDHNMSNVCSFDPFFLIETRHVHEMHLSLGFEAVENMWHDRTAQLE